MDDTIAQRLRALPSVNAIANHPDVRDVADAIPPAVLTDIIRKHVDEARGRIQSGESVDVRLIPADVSRELAQLQHPVMKTVLNGSGVIIQTNLGRAPVSEDAATAMRAVAAGYVALESDLESGQRGGRGAEISLLMRALTGAERTLVVNNNAAAVMLVLMATCQGKEVIVSRGEAVEIGGGFRVPDVLRQSGARLVEVGTTNRTYLADYAAAVTDQTAAFLRVHASNFQIVGFTAIPDLRQLAALAHEHGVLALEDAGSGCLVDTTVYGLSLEPAMRDSIAAGVDVVCASGDKLLGGPQSGIIAGRADVVDRIARHPLARALRADKTCLAGLATTLRHYLFGDFETRVPVWWMISRRPDWVRERVDTWRQQLGRPAEVIPSQSAIGGGSLPGQTLPSYALALDAPEGAAALARRLRKGNPPVVPRIVDNRVTIDGRTILAGQDVALLAALRAALGD